MAMSSAGARGLALIDGSFDSNTSDDADLYDECNAAKAARLRSREGMAVCVLYDAVLRFRFGALVPVPVSLLLLSLFC